MPLGFVPRGQPQQLGLPLGRVGDRVGLELLGSPHRQDGLHPIHQRLEQTQHHSTSSPEQKSGDSTVVPPEYVSAPVRMVVPDPTCATAPEPEMAPE